MALSEAERSAGDLRFEGSFRIGRTTGDTPETYIGHSASYSLPNPMDIVLKAALKLLSLDLLLDFPAGWTPESIGSLAATTGVLGTTIELDAQQMADLIELARYVLPICEVNSLFEVPDDADHVRWMIDVVENPRRERTGL
jgi:hypothetical protein